MNCPHLSEWTVNPNLPSHLNYPTATSTHHHPPVSINYSCSVCKSVEDPWICLQCGAVGCARRIKGHAKTHYDNHCHSHSNSPSNPPESHCIAVQCYSGGVYCYACEDFVSNLPQEIYEKFYFLFPPMEDEDDDDDDAASIADPEEGIDADDETSRTSSMSSISSKNKGGTRGQHITAAAAALVHRNHHGTRKRSTSSASSSSAIAAQRERPTVVTDLTNHHEPKKPRLDYGCIGGVVTTAPRKAKENHINFATMNGGKEHGTNGHGNGKQHGLVGLKNLGNTCFMNAVLQSLSKLRGFSGYIADIPALDELRLNNNNGSGHGTSAFSRNNITSPPKRVYRTRARMREQIENKKNFELEQFVVYNGSGVGVPSNPTSNSVESTEEFLISELKKIVISLNTEGSSAVSPDALFGMIWETMPRFRGYHQQDAHEFLRYMLDTIHTELVRLIPTIKWNDSGKSPKNGHLNGYGSNINGSFGESFRKTFGYHSIVTSLFGGVLENEVRCSECQTVSRKHDPFLDLSLEIPEGTPVPGTTGGNNSIKITKLEDCLSNFTGVEVLSDSDKYYCTKCNSYQKSTKQFSIQRLPNVLCLHLKRFRWTNSHRKKIDHFVQFPMNVLDMSDYVLDKSKVKTTRGSISSNLYDLSAVIVHQGSGVGSGHYTAYAKKDSQWYHFNDTNVRCSEESAVSKCKAYILFYTRNEFKFP